MTHSNLQNILNSIYELEGLVTLALNGKQDVARLYNLMVDKADSISRQMHSLQIKQPSETEAKDDINPKTEIYTSSVYTIEEEAPAPELPIEVVTPKAAPIPQPAARPVQPENVTPKPAAEAPRPSVSSAFPKESKPVSASEPAPRKPLYTSVKESVSKSAPTPSPASAALKTPLRRMFPINEWFLFRRELFAGSDADFNASLTIVEELGSYEKAEAYFYSDLQWNKEEKNVVDFMKIVANYFRQ